MTTPQPTAVEASSDDVRIPASIESARAKLVYLYVLGRGEATADDACDALAIDKGSVLSIARVLCTAGHLERVDQRYRIA